MNMLKVRCCCTPEKILGVLPIPDEHLASRYIHFPILIPGQLGFGALDLEVATVYTGSTLPFPERALRAVKEGELGRGELALKYNDDDETTEEKKASLRRIRGFIECKA